MKKAKKRVSDAPQTRQDPNLGLTSAEAKRRLDDGWGNAVSGKYSRSIGQILAGNLLTFFNLVFTVLALFLAVCGSPIKQMTFLVVVIINIIIGCVQEIRAKQAVDKLSLVAAQNLRTVRDGVVSMVRSDLLVQGDIVEFTTGDQICADGILATGQLQVNESLITGESDAVEKNPGDILRSGSVVIAGTGRAQLTAVGNRSFAAKLAAEAKSDPRVAKAEMMLALDKLLRVVGFCLIPVGILLFAHDFWMVPGASLQTSAEGTVSALVGMIPEGLYLLTSIALAASTLKLSRDRVLVQDMNCIETLARVDVLCVDKTGTITQPGMQLEKTIPLNDYPEEELQQLLKALYSGLDGENDTAKALIEAFSGESDWQVEKRIPFTSQTKWSATVFCDHGTYMVGAPEFVLTERYGEIRQDVESWSCKGYRVLLVAEYAGTLKDAPESGLVHPKALLVLTNPLRNDAKETFSYFAQQGVQIKVISGDNPVTVSDVARRAGIEGAERYIDAQVLETEEDFLQAVEAYTVFGRVTPEQKKKLVQALKKQGHTVAMTGDGVNDMLAMKESDCGIAMAGGAQAASQVARMVLLNSDFAAMPSIVGEGRRVINNIQRAAALFLVKNIFSLGTTLFTLFSASSYPLTPMHMSIISGLTIGLPSFFLAMEPNYERVTGKFLPTVLRKALPGGLTNVAMALILQGVADVFTLDAVQISTICTASLSVVGLLVLFQVCTPFDKFRKVIWGMTAALLFGCFVVTGPIFDLNFGDLNGFLVLLVLLIICPTIFFVMDRLLALADKLFAKIKKK